MIYSHWVLVDLVVVADIALGVQGYSKVYEVPFTAAIEERLAAFHGHIDIFKS